MRPGLVSKAPRDLYKSAHVVFCQKTSSTHWWYRSRLLLLSPRPPRPASSSSRCSRRCLAASEGRAERMSEMAESGGEDGGSEETETASTLSGSMRRDAGWVSMTGSVRPSFWRWSCSKSVASAASSFLLCEACGFGLLNGPWVSPLSPSTYSRLEVGGSTELPPCHAGDGVAIPSGPGPEGERDTGRQTLGHRESLSSRCSCSFLSIKYASNGSTGEDDDGRLGSEGRGGHVYSALESRRLSITSSSNGSISSKGDLAES